LVWRPQKSVEDGIKQGISQGIQSGIEGLIETIKDNADAWFISPDRLGPYQKMFSLVPRIDSPISHDGLSVGQDSWEIFSSGKQLLLFEVPAPADLQECLASFQLQVKCSGLEKQATVSAGMQNLMGWNWCRSVSLQGTKSWHSLLVPFHYKKAEFTGPIQLRVNFEGSGVVWVKGIDVFQAVVKPRMETGDL